MAGTPAEPVDPPRTIVYAGDSAFAPYEYLDPTGQPAGFNIALVRALAAEANVRVVFRLGVWRDMLVELEAGRADLMSVAYSDERSSRFDWFGRTWTLRQSLVGLASRRPLPRRLDMLANETVAVEDRSLVHELLLQIPEVRRPALLLARNQPDALRAVMQRQATLALGNDLTLRVAARRAGAGGLAFVPIKHLSYHLVTRRGNREALAWLPPAMSRLRESGQFDRLVERYLAAPPPLRSWRDHAPAIAAAATIALVLFVAALVWQRALRGQIRARQAAVDRTERLQALTAALAEALTPDQVEGVIVEQGVTVLRARSAAFATVAADGRHLHVTHAFGVSLPELQPWQDLDIGERSPASDALLRREPVLVSSPDEARRLYGDAQPDALAFGAGALAAVPLLLGESPVGVLILAFARPRAFTGEDRALMLALSRQCAQAFERARLWAAERTARAEAEAANRAKDDFLATLSHELRTPLNAIMGWAHMLRLGMLDPAAQIRALDTIQRNAQIQARMIADLLDVSRAVAGKLPVEHEPVDLLACVEAAVETVGPAARARQIAIEVDARDPVRVFGDAARVQQVFWNLLSNAIKFTRPSGRIRVSLTLEGGAACIRVADTGVGIERERLPYIFNRFYQADTSPTREHGGLGLGLAIVRHLVELHGGTVEASSEGPDRGAVFTVRLPVMPAGTAPAAPGPPSASALR